MLRGYRRDGKKRVAIVEADGHLIVDPWSCDENSLHVLVSQRNVSSVRFDAVPCCDGPSVDDGVPFLIGELDRTFFLLCVAERFGFRLILIRVDAYDLDVGTGAVRCEVGLTARAVQ